DALRQLDNKLAASLLSERLVYADRAAAGQISLALTQLGGEEAVKTLQAQQARALENYTQLLGDADKQIMEQFEELMQKARASYSLSMGMHGIIFAVGVVTLFTGLYVALSHGYEQFERYIGTVAAAGSLGTLLLLFYKDPLTNIRRSVTSLVQVNVIFLG